MRRFNALLEIRNLAAPCGIVSRLLLTKKRLMKLEARGKLAWSGYEKHYGTLLTGNGTGTWPAPRSLLDPISLNFVMVSLDPCTDHGRKDVLLLQNCNAQALPPSDSSSKVARSSHRLLPWRSFKAIDRTLVSLDKEEAAKVSKSLSS